MQRLAEVTYIQRNKITMNVIQPRMLSVFDFDGTLTRHDSFIPFSAVCLWQSGVFATYRQHGSTHVTLYGKQMTRDELKETLITTFLTGVEEKWVSSSRGILSALLVSPHAPGRFDCCGRMKSLPARSSALCSASPEIVLLRPFAEKLLGSNPLVHN